MFKSKKQSNWSKVSKGLVYGGFGVSSFMTAFLLRRMLQVKYYKQLEAHEKKQQKSQIKVIAMIALIAVVGILSFTPAGNEMTASLFTIAH
ncbi:MAG: hypothetical protein PHU71_06380 [Candidatus Gracilibacteria bacterium]|nr:hypothetical protein [Candidatus Gracilibacteria bacterium]